MGGGGGGGGGGGEAFKKGFKKRGNGQCVQVTGLPAMFFSKGAQCMSQLQVTVLKGQEEPTLQRICSVEQDSLRD